MLFPRQDNSSLSLYIILSLGFHAFLLLFLIISTPKITPQKTIKIAMNFGSAIPTAPIPEVQKIPSLPTPKNSSQPVQRKKNNTKPIPKQHNQKKIAPVKSDHVYKESIPAKKVEQMNTTPEHISPKQNISPNVLKTEKVLPVPTQQPATTSSQNNQVAEITEPRAITPVIQQKDPSIEELEKPLENQEKIQEEPKEVDILANELDALLAEKKDKQIIQSDFLDDAYWSGSPRKTIAFPNISEQIPNEYKARGYGYSVTASMTFSPQGWVSSVELIRSSGDPRIDGIFRNELRKIRIEQSQKDTYETVVKTFTISIK